MVLSQPGGRCGTHLRCSGSRRWPTPPVSGAGGWPAAQPSVAKLLTQPGGTRSPSSPSTPLRRCSCSSQSECGRTLRRVGQPRPTRGDRRPASGAATRHSGSSVRTDTPRARESGHSVLTPTSRSARSTLPMTVRCSPARCASSSCEKPASCRSRRSRFPNATRSSRVSRRPRSILGWTLGSRSASYDRGLGASCSGLAANLRVWSHG
jgi:hypothetical protein